MEFRTRQEVREGNFEAIQKTGGGKKVKKWRNKKFREEV